MMDPALLNQLSEGVIVADADGKLSFVNDAAARLHGVRALDVAPDHYSDTYHLFTEDGEPYPFDQLPLARAVLRGETTEEARWLIRRPDGSEILAIGSARPLFVGEDRAGGILTLRDDTARHSAELALRASEQRMRLVLDTAPGAFYAVDRDGNTTLVSRGFLEMMGFGSDEDVLGRKLHGVIHHTKLDGSSFPVDQCPIYQCAATGAPAHVADDQFIRPDGAAVPVEYWVSPIMDGEAHIGAACTILDLTERKAAEQALRARSEEFHTLADNIPALAWMAYANGEIFWYNRRWYDYTGTSEESQQGWGWQSVHDPDVAPAVIERWNVSLERGVPFEMTFPLKSREGTFRPFLTRVVPIRDAEGNILRWFGTNVDISDQVEAEQALTRLNETLEKRVLEIADERERAWQLSQELLAVVNADGTFVEVNVAWTRLLGWEPHELLGQPFGGFAHPDDLEATEAKFASIVEAPLTEPYDYRLRCRDGTYRWFSWTAIFEHGRIYGSGRDVNEEKLRQVELESAQEALRQSQKMEAIGQLTGGIAHDFNNLLQIISGNLEIISRSITDESPRLRRSIDNAAKGAERAAVLTQRLLAFSRRQPLAPKVIDVNRLVTGMSEMLHRTLGENFGIETVLGSGLWQVEVDPNQLESALLNLAVNARDAMAEGGKLTIETTNAHIDRSYSDAHSGVTAGQYVLVCVSDTGAGMDPATAERAVEPFFTTKDVGKGTGLGLSMVYGFVKQSGGHFKIYSEPGEGTSVKIYLPRHVGSDVAVDERAEDAIPERSNGETILICEDDEDVRLFTADTLRDLGYRVVEAGSGEEALRLLDGEPEVALLFTDVVLPGMTGAILAAKAKATRPGLPILYTTGYARNAIVHHGRLDPGVELLSKPFTRADLSRRIRDLIDSGSA